MNYYELIFKRKSFHIFKNTGSIMPEEMEDLQSFITSVQPLDCDIKTEIKIVPESETTCKRGAEYCIEFYSEERGNYLRNIGYMGEQIDLWLAGRDIGALWFGIGKPKEKDGATLSVFRYKKPGKRGIMPADKVRFYNRIDIGIFVFMLEKCLEHEGYSFVGTQLYEDEPDDVEKVLAAKYEIKKAI